MFRRSRGWSHDHRLAVRVLLWSFVVVTCLMTTYVRADRKSEVHQPRRINFDDVEDESEADDETGTSETTGDTDEDGDESEMAKTNEDDSHMHSSDHYHPQPMYHHHQPHYHHHESMHKPKKEQTEDKKVHVPVFVPEKKEKKMKIISVDKGFFIQGGTQLFGKYKSLKHCMKACAVTPSCLAGDYNPWLHKCYQHTNFTACNTLGAHPQYIHFSKVPCSVVDAPSGRVTLGASMANGIEQKGIDSLQQCIKKCAIAGGGVQPTATVPESFNRQVCFAIDYDFSTHKCFFFGSNILVSLSPLPIVFYLHCPVQANVLPSSLGSRPNPNVIHVTFCPLPTGFNG